MKKVVCALMIISFFVLHVYAEKVITNDGKEYVGNIHHQDDKVVFIVQKEELIKLNRADVKEIIVEEEKSKKKIDSFIDDLKNNNLENKKPEVILQVGYDFDAKYLHKGSEDKSVSPKGVTFSAKYYHYFMDEFGIGIGANLQTSRELDYLPGRVFFVPAYLSLKLRSKPTKTYKYGYISGNVGYNLFFPNLDYTSYIENEKGGFFYSLNLGFVYNHILLEASVAIHNAKANLKTTTYNVDIEYRTYTISIGYVFC